MKNFYKYILVIVVLVIGGVVAYESIKPKVFGALTQPLGPGVVTPFNQINGPLTIGTGSPVWSLGANSNNSNAFVISPSSTLTPGYLTITQTGTVGISSSTPWGTFSVNGLAGGSIPLFVVASSTSANATTSVMVVDSNGIFNFGVGNSGVSPSINGSGFVNVIVPGVGLSTVSNRQVIAGATAPRPALSLINNNTTAETGLSLTFSNSSYNDNISPSYTAAISAFRTGSSGQGGLMFSVKNSTTAGVAPVTAMVIDQNLHVGIGSTTPIADLQVSTSTANATTSLQFGKPNQNKGTCITYYDTAGTPVYGFIATGATAFTYTATKPSGCQN